jgi:hypothetical protein
MSIYAFAVALWFMAIALVLIGCTIRSWFRSRRLQRPDEAVVHWMLPPDLGRHEA